LQESEPMKEKEGESTSWETWAEAGVE
jgi:hypothetical protein